MQFPTSEHDFLPPILEELEIGMMDVKLFSREHDTEAKKRFEMEITWKEKDSERKEVLEIKPVEEPKKKPKKEVVKKPVESKKELKKEVVKKPQMTEGEVSCDGPCGKYYHPNTMHSMGRCDHYICSFCCDLVGNVDGSDGCSNFECVRRNFLHWMSVSDARKSYNSTIGEKYHRKHKKFEAGQIEMPNGRLGQPSQCNLLSVTPASSIYDEKEAKKGDKRLVRARLFSDGEFVVAMKGKFHVNEKLKSVALKMAKLGFKDFEQKTGIRVFTSRNNERHRALNLKHFELRLGQVVKPNKELRLVIDVTSVPKEE